MDLGLAGRTCVGHRRQPRDRPRDRAAALRRGRRRAAGRPRRAAPASRCRKRPTRPGPRRRGKAAVLALDVTDEDAGERMLAPRRRASAPSTSSSTTPAAASWRDLDDVPDEDWRAPVRAQRDGAAAGDARRRPGDGRARLGPGRQRLLDRRQAALLGDARVLGGEGGRALALAPLRRPLRTSGRARQRDLPRPDRIGDVDGAGRPARPVPGDVRRREPRGGTRRPPAPSGRSAASPRPPRSPPRSSSSAPSAPPTSPAPPGRSTAARSRSSSDGPTARRPAPHSGIRPIGAAGAAALARRGGGDGCARGNRGGGAAAALRLARRAGPDLHRAARRPAPPRRRDLLPRRPPGPGRRAT